MDTLNNELWMTSLKLCQGETGLVRLGIFLAGIVPVQITRIFLVGLVPGLDFLGSERSPVELDCDTASLFSPSLLYVVNQAQPIITSFGGEKSPAKPEAAGSRRHNLGQSTNRIFWASLY
jgi:hypothetical protein